MKNKILVDYSRENSNKKLYKILIIDDDVNIANLFSYYLKDRGHSVTVLDEGCRALYSIAKENYDIIFIDYHLSNDGCIDDKNNNFTGINVIECIQKMSNTSSKLFIYTGDTNKIIMKKIKKLNIAGILYKPLDINTLSYFMSIIEKEFSHNMEEYNKVEYNSLCLF